MRRLILKDDTGAKWRRRGREGRLEKDRQIEKDRNGDTMLWNAVCVQAIFKLRHGQRICRMKTSPCPHQLHSSLTFPSPSLHSYLLCLYYGCYYYSCMSSCRPRFSPSPEQESGHYWHPARLPNQSPLRAGEGGGRWSEGGKRREGEE